MKRLAPWIRFAVSGLLVFLLYRRVPLSELTDILSSVRLLPLGLVFVLTFGNTVLSAIKWRAFLHADGIDVSLPSLVGSYMTGSFFNMFLPSNIGGDVYRVYDVGRASGRGLESFASVFADRLTGFLALVTLGLFFSVVGIRTLPDPRVVLLPALFCAGLFVTVWLLKKQGPLFWVLRVSRFDRIPAISRAAERFLASFRIYSARPGLAARAMAISFLFQISIIFSIWMLSRALGLEIRFLYFCIFVPVISVLEALPITIFGLGVRDASYVFFFGQVGVERVEALSLAVLYVLLTLAYGALGGVVFAVRRSAKQVPAREP